MAFLEDFHGLLSTETTHALLGFLIGAMLYSLLCVKFQPRRKVLSLDVMESPKPATLTAACTSKMPAEMAASIATFSDLNSIAKISTTSTMFRNEFWNRTDVWCEICDTRTPESPSAVFRDSATARNHFRTAYFRIGNGSPEALLEKARNVPSKATEVLEEATHMLHGMMSYDSASSIRCAIDAAENALWVHEARDVQGKKAVKSFMQMARRRTDLVTPWQLEQLTDSLRTAQELEASTAMDVHRIIDEAQGGKIGGETCHDDSAFADTFLQNVLRDESLCSDTY